MKIKVFATYRDIAKAKEVDVPFGESPTVRKLLQALIALIPEFREELFTDEEQLKPFVHVFVNGRNIIHLKGLETSVLETDEIALIPPVAGG